MWKDFNIGYDKGEIIIFLDKSFHICVLINLIKKIKQLKAQSAPSQHRHSTLSSNTDANLFLVYILFCLYIYYSTEHKREGVSHFCKKKKKWWGKQEPVVERLKAESQRSFGFYDKIPRKVFWEKLTRSSFFNIKLGLSHRANLPSAVKDNGDCGEFWEISTDLSYLHCVREIFLF